MRLQTDGTKLQGLSPLQERALANLLAMLIHIKFSDTAAAVSSRSNNEVLTFKLKSWPIQKAVLDFKPQPSVWFCLVHYVFKKGHKQVSCGSSCKA